MKKIFILIFITLFIHIFAVKAYANKVAESSASFDKEAAPVSDKRAMILKRFLEKYDSPLSKNSDHIIATADENDIPWTWIPAISGVESTFCKAIPYNSYNCWGWANGEFYFTDYKDAVSIISKSLKERYVNSGADSIEKIAPIYAPPSKTWAGRVVFFIEQIENFEKNDAENLSISL